ncbi:MAG TPA: hypothetical protein VM282_24505 [Acidimicrobiales bacterium]|nr:hypothetical protein [Acidimicrobiales bacterium]
MRYSRKQPLPESVRKEVLERPGVIDHDEVAGGNPTKKTPKPRKTLAARVSRRLRLTKQANES